MTLKAKFDYLNNQKMDTTDLANQVVRQLESATYIQLCHYNKGMFGVKEEIELYAELKNI